MRRKAAWAAVGIVPTLIAANYMPRLVLYIFCNVLILASAIVGWFRYQNKLIKTFFLLISATIAAISFLIYFEVYDRPISRYESQKITAQVLFMENNSGYWLTKLESATCNGQPIRLHGEMRMPVYGHEVNAYDVADIEFVLHRAERGENGTFLADNITILSVHQPEQKRLVQYLSEFRENVITLLQVRIGGEEGRLAASVLTGESDALSFHTRLSFSRTGLSHVMAVSGLHLSVLSVMVTYLLSRINANWKIVTLVSLLFVGIIVVLGGFSTSVLRAAAMSGIMLAGRLGDREADSLNSLGVALIVIGMIFPFHVVKPSYLLSGAATLGILVLSPILEQFILKRMILSRRQSKQVSLICVSISSAIFTAPILIFYFGEISVLSVPAMSVINYPVMFLLMGSALFCCLFWIPFLGDFIGFLVRIAAQLILELVELFASFDQAAIPVRSLPMILIFAVGFLVILSWFLLKNKTKIRNILIGSMAGIIVILMGIVPFYSLSFSRLTTLNDGTSMYINHGKSIVVNCSSRYLADQVRREIGKQGFDKIDVLLVTDFDEDVSGGIPTLLSYISAKKVIMPRSEQYSDPCREILEAAQKTDAEIVMVDKDCHIGVDEIELNLYVTQEQRFLVKLTDGRNSIGIWSFVNDKTVTQCLQYPLDEWQVDTLVVGPKASKGYVNAKLMYMTCPDNVFVSSTRRSLTLDERLDIEASNAKLCELSTSQLKMVQDYRKERLWIYRNSNYN